MEIKGGSTPSKTCGGTADILPAERARASFDVKKLSEFLNGTAENQAQKDKWYKLFDTPDFDFTYDIYDDRKEAFKKSMQRTVKAHKIVKKTPDLLETHMNGALGKGGPGFNIGPVAQSGSSAAGNHYGIFLGAILARASDEQKAEWFRRTINLEMIGAYAQTELGHGSNVRGLETTATYDPETQEFVIDSPTLTSLKWWPGSFGLIATHSVVYARLIIKGKDYGVHEFMVQLRDENHKNMPGVEVGDIGPKLGYNLVDNGYCRFDHVRIPRKNMLCRYQMVTEDGEYKRAERLKKDDGGVGDKLKYMVMIVTRIGMVSGAYVSLAKAATIATRYSAVRHQGFKNTRENSLTSGEFSVLDYQVQQYRVFKALSMAYAFFFTSKFIRSKLVAFSKSLDAGDVNELPDLHATAAGLKAFCTNLCGDQMEECRRTLGGQGAAMCAGIAKQLADYNSVNPLAEGDKIILALQTARYLVRAAQAANQKKPIAGSVKYLAEEVPNPDFTEKGLRNLDNVVSAFRWRARSSTFKVAAQFQQRLSAGEQFDIAWNNCAVALVKAAEHHCFYVMLSNFASGVKAAKDAAVKKVLERLALHFALVNIRENAADWLPVMNAKGNDAVQNEVIKLLAEIRPDAVSLVDAFGFTDSALGSAVGRYDGNVYEALYEYARNNPLNQDEYIQEVWRDSLSKVIDPEYLKQTRAEQRVGPISSKL